MASGDAGKVGLGHKAPLMGAMPNDASTALQERKEPLTQPLSLIHI